jgi:hypothetical protein
MVGETVRPGWWEKALKEKTPTGPVLPCNGLIPLPCPDLYLALKRSDRPGFHYIDKMTILINEEEGCVF